MPVFLELCTAMGAFLVRQIEAATVFAMRKEFTVLAFRAHVVWRQGIDFCNIGHGRNEGRADRTTGAYEVAIVVGVLYKLMGNVIEHAKAMS